MSSTSSNNKLPIAFLGLGTMGAGMAHRLLGAGFPLAVYNRNAEKAAPFAKAGARVAKTPHEAATGAKIVISMVADDPASRALWQGDQGAITALEPGAICIECSTLTVHWVHDLAAALAARRCEFLDAPVTGTKPHAANGELNFIVGGSAETVEKVRPALAVMSKTINHIGPVGSGAMLKLINNFLCGVQVASMAEAIAMIERSGLDRDRALEFLLAGAAGSPLAKTITARVTKPDFSANFALRLMAKDLVYAISEGKKNAIHLATAAAALEDFQRAINAGHGDEDMAAVIQPMRKTRP
jgi:3-hydroxyisobutyrate dehydrogenase